MTIFNDVTENMLLTGGHYPSLLYDIYIIDCGPRKLQIVKAIKDCVKEATGHDFGLKESKEVADSANLNHPAHITSFAPYPTALTWLRTFKREGATVGYSEKHPVVEECVVYLKEEKSLPYTVAGDAEAYSSYQQDEDIEELTAFLNNQFKF